MPKKHPRTSTKRKEKAKKVNTDQPVEQRKLEEVAQERDTNEGNVSTAQLNNPGRSRSVRDGNASWRNVGDKAARNLNFVRAQPAPNKKQTLEEAGFSKEALKQAKKDINSNIPARQTEALSFYMAIFQDVIDPPIEIFTQAGVVNRCAKILANNKLNNEELHFDAACLLYYVTKINTQLARDVVQAGAVEPLITMLRSIDKTVAEAALRVLTNIMECGPVLRDFVNSKGIVPPLVALVAPEAPESLLKVLASALPKICFPFTEKGNKDVGPLCLPAVIQFIKMTDMQQVSDACYALRYLSCTAHAKALDEIVTQLIEAGVVPRLVQLLDSGNVNVITPCLLAMTYFFNYADLRTQHFIDAGLLPCLARLLTSENNALVRDATRCVRNIAEKSTSHVAEIVCAGIVPLLVNVLNQGRLEDKNAAISALKYIAEGYPDNGRHLYEAQAISGMCKMLKGANVDVDALLITLDTINATLKSAKKFFQFEDVALAVDECEGLQVIKELQNHNNWQICKKAFDIIRIHFGG